MANKKQANPPEVLRKLPLEQSATAAAIVIAPHLPAMERIGEVKTVQRNALLPLMGAGHHQSTKGEGVMAQVPSKMPPPLPHTGKSQEPKAGQVGLSSADG